MRLSLILHPCAHTKKSSVMWPDFPIFSCKVGKKYMPITLLCVCTDAVSDQHEHSDVCGSMSYAR